MESGIKEFMKIHDSDKLGIYTCKKFINPLPCIQLTTILFLPVITKEIIKQNNAEMIQLVIIVSSLVEYRVHNGMWF